VLKEDVKRYRQAWQDAGHPGDPTTVVRLPTLVAHTQAEATRQTEALMHLARCYYAMQTMRILTEKVIPKCK